MAVLQKFLQNEDLQKELLLEEFNGIHFVEASPYDRIWGIGFSVESAMLVDKKLWGQNLLGKSLDHVRAQILYSRQ